jgi:hypothetical protein
MVWYCEGLRYEFRLEVGIVFFHGAGQTHEDNTQIDVYKNRPSLLLFSSLSLVFAVRNSYIMLIIN